MSTAWNAAGAGLRRRLRPLRRYRWWVLQSLAAVPGVVLLTRDTGAPDGSHLAKLWHDSALFFLVLAVTLRVWRAPEEGVVDVLRFRRLHRKIAWRGFTVLMLAATLALTADRWCTCKGEDPAARGWSTLAELLFWLAVAARLLDPLVWRLWPQQLRRSVRVAELAEDAARARARNSTRAVAPPTVFADQGAFGRTRPSYRSAGGPPSPAPQSVAARSRTRRAGPPVLHWDGTRLAWSGADGRTHTVPVDGRPALKGRTDRGLRPVAEMVWLLHRGAGTESSGLLVLLDGQGYRFLVLHTGSRSFGPCADLAAAVGVRFAAYRITADAGTFRSLVDSLFPRRGPVLELRATDARTGPMGRPKWPKATM